MSVSFVIFAAKDPDTPFTWRALNAEPQVIDGGADLLENLPVADDSEVSLVLPGELVTVHLTSLAARSERQMRAAAPFAIEDDVSGDVDRAHVALGAIAAENQPRSLYVIDQEALRHWIDLFEANGVKLHRVVPDHACLGAEDQWLRLHLDDSVLIGNRHWSASIDRALGEDVLGPVVESVTRKWAALTRKSETEDGTATQETTEVAFALAMGDDANDHIARNVVNSPVNLMQGIFAPSNESQKRALDWRRWQVPAAMSTLCVLGSASMALAEGQMMKSQASEMRGETERVFKQAFPHVSRVVNPRAQLRAELAKSGADGDVFLELSSLVTLAVSEQEGLDIQSIRFDADQGQLQASVLFSSYGDMASLKQKIEAAGGVVAEGGSRQSGGRRLGEITVRR